MCMFVQKITASKFIKIKPFLYSQVYIQLQNYRYIFPEFLYLLYLYQQTTFETIPLLESPKGPLQIKILLYSQSQKVVA